MGELWRRWRAIRYCYKFYYDRISYPSCKANLTTTTKDEHEHASQQPQNRNGICGAIRQRRCKFPNHVANQHLSFGPFPLGLFLPQPLIQTPLLRMDPRRAVPVAARARGIHLRDVFLRFHSLSLSLSSSTRLPLSHGPVRTSRPHAAKGPLSAARACRAGCTRGMGSQSRVDTSDSACLQRAVLNGR